MVMPSSDALMVGKKMPPAGKVPAVVLTNPKFAHNVGMVVRLASCYGMPQVWFTEDRVRLDIERRKRVPREERMRGYKNVELIQYDRPFEQFRGATPVAVEVRDSSENLLDFDHPENALYVFGPEDGSLPKHVVQMCHRFVVIPTKHCLNLATAVSTMLWDRKYKRHLMGLPSEVSDGFGMPDGNEDPEPELFGLFDGKDA